MTKRRVCTLMATLFLCSLLHAQPTPSAGKAQRIATRDNVTVPVYVAWRDDAVATVVLFSGGAGGYGQIGADEWPMSSNFLIRSGKRWAAHPFNVVMVGRPSDGIDLALGNVRTGEKHGADNLAIFKAIKQRSSLPLWVVGTSMGTISAAAAAIQDRENLVAGVVLTASVVAYRVPGAVPTQRLGEVNVPTLIVHHEQDACPSCRPHEVGRIALGLVNAPLKKTAFVKGGSGVVGDPCEPMHYHGFVGIQDEVVDLIAAWIIKPAP